VVAETAGHALHELVLRVPTSSPYDARRTFISWLRESGADLASVQRLAGRVRSDITVAYERRGDTAKPQAVDGMPFPYVKSAQAKMFAKEADEE